MLLTAIVVGLVGRCGSKEWTSIPRLRVRFHLFSTFPFQARDQVALAPQSGLSADVHSALLPYNDSDPAHLAHGTEQHAQSCGQELWTDPTVEESMHPMASRRARVSLENGLGWAFSSLCRGGHAHFVGK